MNEQLEREKKIRTEIGQLRVENQWLINNQENSGGKAERMDEKATEIESLMEKNKELKEDNAR